MILKPHIKRILIGFFSIVVFLPLILFITPGREAGVIHRTDTALNHENFTVKSWGSGEFQKSFAKYVNDNLGLFPFFVRVRNQIDYSLFKIAHTGRVVNGSKEYLYELGYIDAYFGKDYAGDQTIQKQTTKLRALQDSLEKRGKLMLFCMAPGKASYFPEYIPTLYTEKYNKQNSREYVRVFQEKEINYIDVLPWFLEMKDTLGYLLYPQYGIHWSYYGSTMVTDSITKKMNELSNWSLPEMTITSSKKSSVIKYRDQDIAHSMNLLFDVKSQPMIYPIHEWSEKKEKKNLLVIGDSFSWDLILQSRIGEECFDSLKFLYYNQFIHKEKENGISTLTRHIDLKKHLDFFDAFLFISSEPNMSLMGFHFIEDALGIYLEPGSKIKKRNNKILSKKCRTNRKWRTDLEKRAEQRGIDLDSMIQIYLFDEKFKPYPN